MITTYPSVFACCLVKIRCELKDHIAGLAPQTRDQLDVSFFNIALTGQIAAGKSSFFNSVNGIYQERIIAGKAEVGIAATSLTQKVVCQQT